MKIHPKTFYCQRAESDLHGVLLKWLEANPELTWAEAVRCLAGIIASWSKYPVREERHPHDDTKKTDEA